MRLTVETGPHAGTQITLDREHPTTLGSGERCAVRIQEPGVAAEHAVVKALRDQGFGVKALAPGLRLNGTEVEASPLREGDVIELGTTRLTYGQQQHHQQGPHITGFRILGMLGRGGMGVVYRAEQVSLHREVALKVLDQKFTQDAQFIARFVAEARAAAKLQHPNVVQVFDVDHDGATYFYAMELMHHGSLEDWLRKHGRMPVERALQVVADAASGLAYAESLRIVHRDIKPDNLMLDQHGTVKIADLGLAHTDADPEEVALTGTPHFMAPEQVLRKGVDHRTDLYALGCTFYRLITGRTPFRGQSNKDILRAHVKDVAEPAHKIEPLVPAEVSSIVQKLMAKEPADRYQSADDLLEAVNLLLQPPARKALWIGLAAAAVLVAGGAIAWAVTRPKEQTIVEKYRDNPEAQRLATENEALKTQGRQDAATIALLRTRLRGLGGEELARALDEVAGAHAGTAAAEEAKSLAGQTRSALAAQQAVQAQQQQATAGALAALAQQVDTALAAGDPPAALAALDKAAAPVSTDGTAFAAGLQQQRARVQAAAAQRLAALGRDVEGGRTGKDPRSLEAAAQSLQKILAAEGGWPPDLLPDRAAVERALAAAQTARAELLAAASSEQWQRYDALLRDEQNFVAPLQACDFAAAGRALATFADGLGDAPAAAQAQQLAAALLHAGIFADALATALGSGKLVLACNGDQGQLVLRWQRAEAVLVLQDASKKPPKEVQVPVQKLTADQWAALCAQVPGTAEGSRECFVAFAALAAHTRQARAWLAGLQPANDDSGTGDAGYPGATSVFDLLLRLLPAADAPWCTGVRHEVTAGRLLASGLRALSERRNLAAAAQLEKLLGEHPHSLVVTLLP